MKKYISKIIFSIILFGIVIVSPNVYAASATITASSQSVYVGDNAYVTVSIYAAAWNVNVSGSASGTVVGYNEDAVNVSKSQTFPINTTTPGTYTVSISGDVTDETQDTATPVSGSATITVVERPQPTPVIPPANNNTNTGGTTTNGNTNSNNANSNANNNNTNENTETKIEETTTDKEPAKELKPLEITKFEVLGYDLKFDRDTKIYELKIDKNVTKLYLIVEGKDITIEGNGIVDITDKDKVTLKIKNSDQEVEYTINLKKQALGANVIANTKNQGNIFMATTVIFGWSTLILAFFLVKDIIKFKKQNKKDSL